LLFAYFVPGVRHLVALLAGVSNLPLNIFALFAIAAHSCGRRHSLPSGTASVKNGSGFLHWCTSTVVIAALAVFVAIIVGLLIMPRRGGWDLSSS
jgi:membrane protein DedA with SNARE-associated domain